MSLDFPLSVGEKTTTTFLIFGFDNFVFCFFILALSDTVKPHLYAIHNANYVCILKPVANCIFSEAQ